MTLLCTQPLGVINEHAIIATLMPPTMLTTAPLDRERGGGDGCKQNATTGKDDNFAPAHVRDA
jgi:hypothetical protein